MRIKMLRDRLFRVPTNRRRSYQYKAGCWYTVKHDWGEALVADGDAEAVDAPTRPAAPARRRRAPAAS